MLNADTLTPLNVLSPVRVVAALRAEHWHRSRRQPFWTHAGLEGDYSSAAKAMVDVGCCQVQVRLPDSNCRLLQAQADKRVATD